MLDHAKPDGSFEERKVRLLFVSGDRRKSIYVDQKGAVALNGSISCLTKRDFNELKELMRRIVTRNGNARVPTQSGDPQVMEHLGNEEFRGV